MWSLMMRSIMCHKRIFESIQNPIYTSHHDNMFIGAKQGQNCYILYKHGHARNK